MENNNIINPKPSHKKRNLIILTIIIIIVIFIFPIPVDTPIIPADQNIPTIYSEKRIPSFDIAMENNELFISQNQDNGTHFRITVTEGVSNIHKDIP